MKSIQHLLQRKYLDPLLLFRNATRLFIAYAGKSLNERNVTSWAFQRIVQTLINMNRFIEFLDRPFVP